MIPYWYHFAIMFEALFILTTIDAGTRVGRFLLQELFGKLNPRFGRADWWPGALLSTALIVAGWGYLIQGNSMDTIWPMFGIANQMLAAIALAVVSVVLLNEGKSRYLAVTLAPMCVVILTTTTAAAQMLTGLYITLQTQFAKSPGTMDSTLVANSATRAALIMIMLLCGYTVILAAVGRLILRRPQPAGFPVVR
jgi:carbon starvation protein